MRVLLDTNILLRYLQISDAQHRETSAAIDELIRRGEQLILIPHVIYELWVVASRPQNVNGLGWSLKDVRETVNDLISQFAFVDDLPGLFPAWLQLVTEHGVSGKPAHDAKLAAAYLVHGLDALLTHNGKDFKRFDLNVLSPAEVQ